MVPWQTLVDDAAPVVNTLKKLHFGSVRLIVLLGALTGMISSLLVFQLGQARVWFAMSRDGLLPKIFSRVHPGSALQIFPLGSLASSSAYPRDFSISARSPTSPISARCSPSLWLPRGVLILRYREPNRHRAFRAPGGPLAPIMTILTCLLLMAGLPITNWIRFFVWLAVGLVIYYNYGRKRSTLRAANQA